MSNEEFDARARALQYAARLKGLWLVRTGDTFALAEFKVSGATLEEIAAYLGADGSSEDRPPKDQRRADLQALLKAEHALLAELEMERRAADERSRDRGSTEAALAEIRRRIAELSEARETEAREGPARHP